MQQAQPLIMKAGLCLEWLIQQWVKYTGRLVQIDDAIWLTGPTGTSKIGVEIYESYAKNRDMNIEVNAPDSGLLANFHDLNGSEFISDQVDQGIRDFYERTVDYTIDVWSQWSSILQPFAKVLITLVSRQIGQLNLPLSPLETSHGMNSDIISMTSKDGGNKAYAGWLRTTKSTHAIIYAGFYTVCTPASYPNPCVKVVFPLPGGSTTVFLRPQNQSDGSFKLISAGHGFGTPGYYRIHQISENAVRVKYLPLKEVIHVYHDDQSTLRTEHTFMFLNLKFLTLHYKICPK